jgi:hypothetical protein
MYIKMISITWIVFSKIKALTESSQTFDPSKSFFYARISQDTNFSENYGAVFENWNTQLLLTYKNSITYNVTNLWLRKELISGGLKKKLDLSTETKIIPEKFEWNDFIKLQTAKILVFVVSEQ